MAEWLDRQSEITCSWLRDLIDKVWCVENMSQYRAEKTNYRRRALLITVIAIIIVYVMWNIPALSMILYPLRLFTTYVHEAGHAVATIISGGHVLGFLVSPDGSGLTTRAGGWDWLIGPAGYLGAALFGSALFYVINRMPRYVNGIAVLLGAAMVIFTVLFARSDEQGLPVALLLGVGAGMLLIVLGMRVHGAITLLILNVLAVSTALEAFFDLRYLIWASGASRGAVMNDAAQFSQRVTPLIPPALIALIWAAIAIIMFGIALYYGVWKPFRQEIDDSYNAMIRR
jgi:hypothetical protein